MTNLERIKNNSVKEIAELFDKIYIYGSKGENLLTYGIAEEYAPTG